MLQHLCRKHLNAGACHIFGCLADRDFSRWFFYLFRTVHDFVTDSRELRTGLADDNLCHDISAECRTDLYQIGVGFHLQLRTVCRQTRMETGRKTRCQGTTQGSTAN